MTTDTEVQPQTESPRLRAALDRLYEVAASGTPDPVSAAKVAGLLLGYDARWGEAEWRLVGEPESILQTPLVNPDTSRTSRTFVAAGRRDGIVAGYGRRCLLEHKSTSDDIGDPNGPYWRRLAVDAQVSHYLLQQHQLGETLDGCLYDVVRKPAIRPKQVPKAEAAALIDQCHYAGFVVPEEEIGAFVVAGDGIETPFLYGLRVARESLAEPERYFQRRHVPRIDADLLEHAREQWDIAQEIVAARRSGRHYRNSAACIAYGRPCEYLGICSGHDTAESDRWRRAAWTHDELPQPDDGAALDLLTQSRMQVFQTCRRKHHLRYDVGLRRVDEPEAEALHLGRLLHEALAAWWAVPPQHEEQ